MKKFLIFLVYLLLFSNILYSDVGKSAVPLVSISSFAKAEGMAGAFGAMFGDIDSVYYNPAGISPANKISLSFSMQNWLGDMNNMQIGVLYPIKSMGTTSILISYWELADPILGYDETGRATGNNIDVNNLFIILSYGKTLLKSLSIGFNLKYINEKISDSKDNIFALDIGLNYNFPGLEGLNLGVVVQNIGSKIGGDILPLNFKISSAYDVKLKKITAGIEDINWGVDFNLPYGSKINFAVGSEINFIRINQEVKPALRLGIKLPADIGGLSLLSFGAGLNWKNFNFDYCLNPNTGISEYVNKVSITYKFDTTVKEKEEKKEKTKEIRKEEKPKEENKEKFEKELEEF